MMTRSEALSLARVCYAPLPETINGAVRLRDDGRYLIVISSSISAEAQEEALEHELSHIRLDHFQSEGDIGTIEAEAEALSHATLGERYGRRRRS